MLRVGIRVIRAELAARPVQAALTALVAVAVGALLVTLHLRSAIDAPFERLMRSTNGPHLTAITSSASAAERLRNLPGVAQSDSPRLVVEAPAQVDRQRFRLTFVSLPPGGAKVDQPLLLRGRGLRGPDELLAAHGLEREQGVEVGDRVPVGEGSRRRVLRVVGVAATARRGHVGWISPEQASALATPERPARFAVELRLTDPAQADELAARVARTQAAAMVFDWQRDRTELTDESRRGLAILGASTLLALLAVAFTLATAIGGRMFSQRRQIGLLRAIGLTPVQVTGLLLAHYLALALLAAPIGLVGGALASRRLLSDTAALLASPPPGLPGPGLILGALAGALVVVAAATALPAWRAGRLAVTTALALGRGATSARASRVARVARRLHLPVVVALGAKDAFAQRGRTIMTIASLGLAVTLVASAMGFEATMDRLGRDPALRAQPYDLTAGSSTLSGARIDALLERRPEVAAVARIREIPMVEPRTGIEIHTRVVDGPLRQFAYAVPDGRGARTAGEATLGRGALEAFGVSIGDRIQLRAARELVSLRVVGRHVEPDDKGRGAVIPRQGLPDAVARLGGPFWAVRLHPGADSAAVAAALRRDGAGALDVERPIESLQREAADIRPVVYGTTVLLLAIAFVNLLTTLLIGIRERERDFAILASIGATPRQVLATVVSGGSALALPATLVGLPLGTWIFLFMIGVTDPADGPDVAALPSWWWFPLVLPAALALTALVSLLAARQATRIHPAPALRAE